jgi:hypothetical protein
MTYFDFGAFAKVDCENSHPLGSPPPAPPAVDAVGDATRPGKPSPSTAQKFGPCGGHAAGDATRPAQPSPSTAPHGCVPSAPRSPAGEERDSAAAGLLPQTGSTSTRLLPRTHPRGGAAAHFTGGTLSAECRPDRSDCSESFALRLGEGREALPRIPVGRC